MGGINSCVVTSKFKVTEERFGQEEKGGDRQEPYINENDVQTQVIYV